MGIRSWLHGLMCLASSPADRVSRAWGGPGLGPGSPGCGRPDMGGLQYGLKAGGGGRVACIMKRPLSGRPSRREAPPFLQKGGAGPVGTMYKDSFLGFCMAMVFSKAGSSQA